MAAFCVLSRLEQRSFEVRKFVDLIPTQAMVPHNSL